MYLVALLLPPRCASSVSITQDVILLLTVPLGLLPFIHIVAVLQFCLLTNTDSQGGSVMQILCKDPCMASSATGHQLNYCPLQIYRCSLATSAQNPPLPPATAQVASTVGVIRCSQPGSAFV